jgi:hypothetical protein
VYPNGQHWKYYARLREPFKMMTGVNLFHVPYRGAQVLIGLIIGEVQVYFGQHVSQATANAAAPQWRG